MSFLLLCLPAHAEGTAEFGATQSLDPTTRVYVDVLDYTSERITWEGSHDIDVSAPDGTAYGTFSPGDTFSVTSDGAWIVDPTDYETDWDLSVSGVSGVGRVWSYAWFIDASEFDEAHALDSSFYAVVDGGGDGYDGVVEMKTDGFAGNLYVLLANSEGIGGADGRSISYTETTGFNSEFRIYLNPPEDAAYNTLDPAVTGETWSAGALGCDEAAYGYVDGEFTFTASLEGTYHIVCDLNRDGEFDITADDDLQLLGDADAGENTVAWDATDNAGNPVSPGTYSCEILLTVGEFHYVAADVETSYEGFRLFSVDADGQRSGLRMFWNDAGVAASEDEAMPNGEWSLESSGADGVDSGDYTEATVPNDNARSWGTFDSTSKGNEGYLDTYTWIDDAVTSRFTITVADSDLDTDADGLMDVEEDCTYGTDPEDADTDDDALGDYEEAVELPTDPLSPDTDADGVPDGTECGDVSGCADTDGDGTVDPLDPDDDGDGVNTIDEGAGDTDGDGAPDYLDLDDDGDGVATADEDTDGDGNATSDDWDGDGTPNRIDTDDDGDGALTADEDLDGDGDPRNDDTDTDFTANWLDTDDDDDGILSVLEDADGDGTPVDDDTDGDGAPDYLDLDSDGDGIPDETEGAGDTDGDGAADFQDTDADGDGLLDQDEGIVDSDEDGASDYQDPDDDGDTVPTADEAGVDTDGDGFDDHLDPDDDGDGILTSHENDAGWEDDVDGDGTNNWRDLDADGDGLPDADEGEVDFDEDGLPDYVDPDGAWIPYYKGGCDGCNGGGGSPITAGLAVLGALVAMRRRSA